MAQETTSRQDAALAQEPESTAAQGPPPVPGGGEPRAPLPISEIAGLPEPRGSGTAAGAEPGVGEPDSVPKRRAAGPARGRVAANDDAPSIGGLIYALQQKPSRRPLTIAGFASAAWLAAALLLGGAMIRAELSAGQPLSNLLLKPAALAFAATIIIPVALFWFLAVLVMRAQELRQMSSAMTEVAVRLAEPDRTAEQQIASLGQSVRRQVNYMNDAVDRALGRASELETLLHNEVASLDRSYSENETRIRGLISELSGERQALLNTGDKVSETLRGLGSEIPAIIDRLSEQQIRLASFIDSTQQNLGALETSLANRTDRIEGVLTSGTQLLQSTLDAPTTRMQQLIEQHAGSVARSTEQIGAMLAAQTEAIEGTLGQRTNEVQAVFENFSEALTQALGDRTGEIQQAFHDHAELLDTTLSGRTEGLQSVFEEYARALDSALANRQQALDLQIIERTNNIDQSFQERLEHFDASVRRSASTLDNAVGERARLLTEALSRQANEFDEALTHGINAVRRTSESVTRQSLKAIEGLAAQADTLRNVSENMLSQVNSVTGRFESHGQNILKAANALESANLRIDSTIQNRQLELSRSLDLLTSAAQVVGDRLASGTETRSRATLAELERLKYEAGQQTDEALAHVRDKFQSVTREMSDEIGSLGSRFSTTTSEMRDRATQTLAEIESEQRRLRRELEQLPETARVSVEGMRASLQEQLRALDELAALNSREATRRDVAAPGVHGGGAARPQRAGATLGGGRDGWSLGDLLARASREEEGGGHAASASAGAAQPQLPPSTLQPHPLPEGDPPVAQPLSGAPAAGPQFNLYQIARALDPTTASAIWSRFRGGQRGIMVRSIYTTDGRATFDEVSRRYTTEPEFQRSVDRYLGDFERLLVEAEEKDSSGRTAQSYIVSDSGRVYLFLAHASNRLS